MPKSSTNKIIQVMFSLVSPSGLCHSSVNVRYELRDDSRYTKMNLNLKVANVPKLTNPLTQDLNKAH